MLTTRWKKPETPVEPVAASPASRIGRGLTIRGIVETAEEIHVHGTLLGPVKAGRLVLGADGYIEGDVVAREVLLCGHFNGRLFALDVAIAAGANIQGKVFHHTISVAKGAQIEARMPWRPINFFETLEDLPKE